MEESQQKILTNQSLGSPVPSGAHMPLREGCPELIVGKLLAPIRNFPFRLKYAARGLEDDYAIEVFWCFQRCAECGRDIDGLFAILVPPRFDPHHVSCLLRRGLRAEREMRKADARRAIRDRRIRWLEVERAVGSMSPRERRRLSRLVDLARGPR